MVSVDTKLLLFIGNVFCRNALRSFSRLKVLVTAIAVCFRVF